MQTPKRLDPPLRYDLLPCHPQTPARNSSTPPQIQTLALDPPHAPPKRQHPPPGPFYRPRRESSKKATSGPDKPNFSRQPKRLMSQSNGAIPVDQKLSPTSPFSTPRTPPCDSPGPSKPHFSPNSMTRQSNKNRPFPTASNADKACHSGPGPYIPNQLFRASPHLFLLPTGRQSRQKRPSHGPVSTVFTGAAAPRRRPFHPRRQPLKALNKHTPLDQPPELPANKNTFLHAFPAAHNHPNNLPIPPDNHRTNAHITWIQSPANRKKPPFTRPFCATKYRPPKGRPRQSPPVPAHKNTSFIIPQGPKSRPQSTQTEVQHQLPYTSICPPNPEIFRHPGTSRLSKTTRYESKNHNIQIARTTVSRPLQPSSRPHPTPKEPIPCPK